MGVRGSSRDWRPAGDGSAAVEGSDWRIDWLQVENCRRERPLPAKGALEDNLGPSSDSCLKGVGRRPDEQNVEVGGWKRVGAAQGVVLKEGWDPLPRRRQTSCGQALKARRVSDG